MGQSVNLGSRGAGGFAKGWRTRGLFGPLFVVLMVVASGCPNAYDEASSALAGGDYEGARAAARDGLLSDPSQSELHLIWAQAELGLGNPGEAASQAEAALEGELSDTQRGEAHRLAAEAHVQLDHAIEAALHAGAAWELGAWPGDGNLDGMLREGADAALHEERPQDALVILRHILQIHGDSGSASDQGLIDLVVATGTSSAAAHIERRQYTEALALLEELNHELPEATSMLLLRAQVELRRPSRGRHGHASATLRSAQRRSAAA
jgi:hypothetical protein